MKLTPTELLKEYGMSDVIPIDSNKLLDRMNIRTYSIDFSKIEKSPNIVPFVEHRGVILGTVMFKANNVIITYRKSAPICWKRFIVAHLFARYYVENDFKEKFIQFKNDFIANANEMERRCNAFASELLIPEHIIRVLNNRITVFPLERISQIFDVPVSVMAERLNTLYIPYIKMNRPF